MKSILTQLVFLVAYLPVCAQQTGPVDSTLFKTVDMNDVVIVSDMAKKDADKETVFITDSLRKGTANVAQLLDKIPGITADWATDEISIGKDKDVPIIVNGKDVKKDYAIGINPQRVKRVEIMRYPAGKYSDYPIVLNLVLKNEYEGWDMNTFARGFYSFRNRHSNNEALGANFTYSLAKVNVYGNIGLAHRQVYETSAYECGSGDGATIKTDGTDHKNPNTSTMGNSGELNLGFDYKLSDLQMLSLQAWMEKRGTKLDETYRLWEGGTYASQRSEDDYETDDYTIGLYYTGKFFSRLDVSSELVYNRYDIDEDRLYSTDDELALNPYKGNKDYWRYYVSGRYLLNDYLTFMADFTQTWKDYTNTDREDGGTLYKSEETRSKLMGALFYRPLRNLNFLLGSHVLKVTNKEKLTGETQRQTSWMPLGKAYWKPFKWVSINANYFCDVEYPNLDQLSTVGWQVNDLMWHRGNAGLKPRVMHYTEFTLDFTNIVKVNYMFKRSKNEIVDYYLQDGDRTWETQTNCNYEHNYIGLEGDYQLAKGLEFSFTGNYQWYYRYRKGENKHFGRTWYLDTNLQWQVPQTKWSVMASYFVRHDKFPMLQGKQYNEEEDLCLTVSYPLQEGKLPISIMVKVPSELISKQTYTKVDTPNFSYHQYGDDRVNAFCAVLSVKFIMGKGKTSKNDVSKNTDMEK